MAITPGWRAAMSMASSRLESEASTASTSTIFAFGAMACAHSTSSAVSRAHSARYSGKRATEMRCRSKQLSAFIPLQTPGRPKRWLNALTSSAMRGSLYATTTAMVVPAPSWPRFRPRYLRMLVGL